MISRMAAVYAVVFTGGFLLGLLTVEVSEWFVVPLVLLVIGGGLLLMQRFRCPQCNKPVLINPIRILGTEIWICTVLPPPKCSKCGAELK